MHHLSNLDYTIIAGYLLVTMLAGIVMVRRASSSLEHYFLGGRRMSWKLLGVAGMTDWFDITGTMIITSFIYMLGPRGLFVEFRGGAVLVLAFMLCYTGKWHRRSGCMTGAEWNIFRFGSGFDAQLVRVIGAALGLASTVGLLAYLVKGSTLFLGMFFPWPPLYVTLFILGLTTIYTMCAGFYGRVITDLLQGIIIMIACVLVAFAAWRMVPDAESLAAVAAQATGNPEWNRSTLPFHVNMPAGYTDYSWLFMFAMFYLVRNVLSGMGSGGDPRYFGARSDRDCGLQSLLQGVTVAFRWPMMMGFAVMGIYLVSQLYAGDMSRPAKASALIQQHHPAAREASWQELTQRIANAPEQQPADLIDGLKQILGEDWQRQVRLVGIHGTVNPELILPAVLMETIPSGLRGFIFVALLAALMSTLSGIINSAGALFVKDIWQNLVRPGAGNRELICMSWLTSAGLVLLGVLMGVATDNINKIWGWLIMSLSVGSLAPGLLRLYWWRLNAWGCLGGTVFGLIGSILQYFMLPNMLQYEKLSPAAQAWISASLPGWLVRALHMPAEWQMFLCFSFISFSGAILFSLLTPPTNENCLMNFYRTTRPFGFWSPIRHRFDQELLASIDRENRHDIIAVPFTMLAQVTLFLLPMQLVIKAYDAFLGTLPLFLVGAAGMYWFWWRNLPAAVQPAESAQPARGKLLPVLSQNSEL